MTDRQLKLLTYQQLDDLIRQEIPEDYRSFTTARSLMPSGLVLSGVRFGGQFAFDILYGTNRVTFSLMMPPMPHGRRKKLRQLFRRAVAVHTDSSMTIDLTEHQSMFRAIVIHQGHSLEILNLSLRLVYRMKYRLINHKFWRPWSTSQKKSSSF